MNNINNIVVWGHPVVVRTLRMVSMKERTLTPSTNHSQKIIISLSTRQSIKREAITMAITMLKVVILAMCFEGDITFVISELKAKASLREFRGVHDVPDAKEVYRFTVDQFM